MCVCVCVCVCTALLSQRFEEYEHAYNTLPAGGIPFGCLTVDGVHPCEVTSDAYPFGPPHTHGNYMMADVMADSLLQLVAQRNASSHE